MVASVSADLGAHPSLAKRTKARATVAAIVDGTGSIGKERLFYYCFLTFFITGNVLKTVCIYNTIYTFRCRSWTWYLLHDKWTGCASRVSNESHLWDINWMQCLRFIGRCLPCTPSLIY